MELSIVGLNHRVAPVDVREKLAFEAGRLPDAIQALRQATGAAEAVILSTCNRVEIYSAGLADGEMPAAAKWLSEWHHVPENVVRPILYRHGGLDAVRHLYRVASGLDAMVVGETQIIAQVKTAYQTAKEAGHTGRVFNHLFQRALHVAKQIHSTTTVGSGNVSVPSVSARLAEKVFQQLSSKRILILGAGETGELTLAAFRDRGAANLAVINRTAAHAERLTALYGCRALPMDRLADALPEADIVISCLAGSEFHVTKSMVESALRTRRGEPMVLIDLGVPRNVHPDVHQLENIYLFNVDDLERIVHQNVIEREREMAKCLPLIELEARQALIHLGEPATIDLVARLRESFHAVGDGELKITLDKLAALPADQKDEIRHLLQRTLNKILHSPTAALKESAHPESTPMSLMEAVERLFRLK